MDLFTRSGHLTDLALEAMLLDELSAEAQHTLQGHLTACERCQDLLTGLEEDQQLPLPELTQLPPSLGEAPAPGPPANRLRWVALAAAAMLSVGLGVRQLSKPTTETFQLRGSGLSMTVMRQTDRGSEPLGTGDEVVPGDKLGFIVRTSQAGYLLIYGKDDSGALYSCFPRGAAPHAAQLAAGEHALDVAVQLDDRLGQEQLTAMLCDTSFDFPPPEGGDCAVQRVMLTKRAP